MTSFSPETTAKLEDFVRQWRFSPLVSAKKANHAVSQVFESKEEAEKATEGFIGCDVSANEIEHVMSHAGSRLYIRPTSFTYVNEYRPYFPEDGYIRDEAWVLEMDFKGSEASYRRVVAIPDLMKIKSSVTYRMSPKEFEEAKAEFVVAAEAFAELPKEYYEAVFEDICDQSEIGDIPQRTLSEISF